ncbi:polyphosphate kinase 1 [Sellimonas intestinalis]|uniref:Polyphosphate kinase n=2 Tax=Sellimonas intestinalis TaxID=1653434 RepID=A0A3E3K6K1_9FIRM|nr:polyphosphate kinase 1 [Sellimonas intestinalis]PWM92040.1 MAG: polyphosphate kinase 1 [Ruminococcus sp.]MTS22949.1 polyphosphate kinase 1 [Sellimonas intestinalis]RGD38924.1 polyphosphate kinase 1 [Sellimonas intestinalis]RGE52288.1 polyphosphate kinase 1 [Sellimonas intestinalis]RGE55410.1 polyphosphate kinase 1 [Sellimonas intestinalis]
MEESQMDGELLKYTQNRELSWLKFNQRVLEEAQDPDVPLLERMKFVAIFTSNLDEFFMIRVGSLYDMASLKEMELDRRSKMTPKEQLERIYEAVEPLYKERDKTYSEIKKRLSPYGICGLSFKELQDPEKKYVKKYFKEQILPVLSPQIVDRNHPFPHLLNKEIYVIASLKRGNQKLFGLVPVPTYLSEILLLPGHDIRYIRMEKILMEYLEIIFDKYEVSDKNYICVTRNGDVSPDDEALDINEDFRNLMKKTLSKRRKMAVVRLETANPLTENMERYFCDRFCITPKQIFRTKMPMKLSYIFSVAEKVPEHMRRTLIYEPFVPQKSAMVDEETSMIRQIRKKDILLSYPYESMEPFLKLLKEASTDPSVVTIKITIYRLSKKARLVEYLCAAAENGKEVTVLIELRARFDEQNNIDWSERLEDAGCRVIYGFENYKVHSKICLITCKTRNGYQYITQIGTGNYNEKTAAMYTDVCLMTADREIGQDGAAFFQNMCMGNLGGSYRHLLVSPYSLKKKVLELIEEETRKGENGRIIMKMNSVTDVDFIEQISRASRAGVEVDLLVRGICCIRPGVEGYTDHVRVTSIVGRFLEHPRIFSFGRGSAQKLYIGSADMMTRNTEKRVEVGCPVYDEDLRARLNHMLQVMLEDNVKARVLDAAGTYLKKGQGEPFVDAQEVFMQEAVQAAAVKKPAKRSIREVLFGIFRR